MSQQKNCGQTPSKLPWAADRGELGDLIKVSDGCKGTFKRKIEKQRETYL